MRYKFGKGLELLIKGIQLSSLLPNYVDYSKEAVVGNLQQIKK